VSMDAVSGQVDALRQAAEAGDAEGMWQYALTLIGVTIAPPEPGATLFPQLRTVATALEYGGHQDARDWVQRSADAGNTHAMVVEAVLLERTDRQRAEQLAGQAAGRGDTAAMLYLADLLAADGNRAAARDWYARLADLGDHAAMALLGEMLLDEDPQEARSWLRRAADAGIVRAQNDLARLGALQPGPAPVVKMKRGQHNDLAGQETPRSSLKSIVWHPASGTGRSSLKSVLRLMRHPAVARRLILLLVLAVVIAVVGVLVPAVGTTVYVVYTLVAAATWVAFVVALIRAVVRHARHRGPGADR
jgi:TPR repeat protein